MNSKRKKILIVIGALIFIAGILFYYKSNSDIKVSIMNGNNVLKQVEVKKGTVLKDVEKPTIEGKEFSYWEVDGEKVDDSYKITKDTKLNAIFKDSKISLIKVPCANKELIAQTEITEDDIDYVEINVELLKNANLITSKSMLIGKYVNVGTSIPKGGLFYSNQIVSEDDLPSSILSSVPKGYTIYQMDVDNKSTYGNSIYPGDKIDLYIRFNKDESVINGKFIENVEVLAVRDSSGQDVFDDYGKRDPALLIFAIDDQFYCYLKAAEKLSNSNIYPVPRGGNAEDLGNIQFANEEAFTFIKSKVAIDNCF